MTNYKELVNIIIFILHIKEKASNKPIDERNKTGIIKLPT